MGYCRLFEKLDVDSNGYLSPAELRALIIGIEIEEVEINMDDAVYKVIEDFDTSRDLKVDSAEFIEGISKWLRRAKRTAAGANVHDDMSLTTRLLNNFDEVLQLLQSVFYLKNVVTKIDHAADGATA